MTGSNNQADDIRGEMDRIRGSIDKDLRELADGARHLTDWRTYIKAAPLGTLAAAATVGFLLVPKRIEVLRPSDDDISRLAKEHRLVVKNVAKQPGQAGTALKTVLTMAANAALRAGAAYASQNAGKLFGQSAAEARSGSRAEPHHAKAAQP